MHCFLSEENNVKIFTYFKEGVIKRDPQPDSYWGQCKLGLIKCIEFGLCFIQTADTILLQL